VLPKINRLKKKKNFERVFKKGKSLKEDFLLLKFIKNNSINSRFGIIISRKVSKKVVIRNKIKRRIRAIIFSKLPQIKENIDAVLIVLPGIKDQGFWKIKEIIDKIFTKTKLF